MRRGAILKEQVEEKLVKMRALTAADIETGEREVSYRQHIAIRQILNACMPIS